MEKERMSEGEAVCATVAVEGYAFGVAILRWHGDPAADPVRDAAPPAGAVLAERVLVRRGRGVRDDVEEN